MSTEEANGKSSDLENDEDTSEAQAQVIASLRAQVTDLFSQVTQLNNKLVSSYDRVSDLEDQLHDASSSLRNASLTISSLELERSHHLAALNTGLLVEKAHVTAELNRLMERATEEAAQRGQAESARRDIEKDLDDLSATLFDQANTMVAEARLNQARSERKVSEAEQALKMAEDAVKDMQVQMQVLSAEKEAADRGVQEAKATMRKGKWVERVDLGGGDVPRIRFMTTHTPYTEFVAFVGHLRGMRATQPAPPAISTLLTQPFIARLLTEDSEPTVRLDLAPSLNWLSRRSVLAAIHSGMLTVEPLSFSSLVQELHQHPPSTSSSSLSCALCGALIAKLPSSSPVSRTHHTNGSSWFKYPLALSSTQNHKTGKRQSVQCEPPGQVYVFRVTVAAASTPPAVLTPAHNSSASVSSAPSSSRPALHTTLSSSRVLPTQIQNSPYPLCASNYCMTRLRSTCSLWAFVRVGIVERIWDEEVVQPVNGDARETGSPTCVPNSSALPLASEKPPMPPRRRRLWDMAVGWGKEGAESVKEKEKDEKENAKNLPTPPPSHPSNPRPLAEQAAPLRDPPPLPKRKAVPDSPAADEVAPPETQVETITITPEHKDPVVDVNGHASPDKATTTSEPKDSVVDTNGHVDLDKADTNTSGFSTPPDEITFAAPLPETFHPPPSTTSQNALPTQDVIPPPSPHSVPLPMTPTTPNLPSRVASPAPRPRPLPSSPSPPPASSRPASPAVGRSRAGSPAPQGITRTASPSPGQPPSISHIRGKTSVSSPLASSRPASPAPASGPGAPPLPRRAAARRAVPPPPTSGSPKAAGEAISSGSTVAPEADVRKTDDVVIPMESHGYENEGGNQVVKEAIASTDVSVPTEMTVADASRLHNGDVVETNGTSAAVHSDSPPPLGPTSEGDGHGHRTSMDTTSTKRSSTSEGEGFAGDATWEERTWKELVKLKEDMFLARVGGVRASQQ